MINEFSCRNFRNVMVDQLTLKKLNVLIGPNNSGKSNFIKAITFYSNILKHSGQGKQETAFLNAIERNGWEHIHSSKTDEQEPIQLSWKMGVGNKAVSYHFNFIAGSTPEECHITLEELDSEESHDHYPEKYNYYRVHSRKRGSGRISTAISKGSENKRLPFTADDQEVMCLQFRDILLQNENLYSSSMVKKDISNLLADINTFFRSIFSYSSARFNLEMMRSPADPRQNGAILEPDGTNIANVFSQYKAGAYKWKKQFTDEMRFMIHDLEDIDVISLYDHLILRLTQGDYDYDLSDVSDGTLKALLMNMIFNGAMNEPYSILVVDEPETNMHPAWLKVLGDWIQNGTTYEQCFISTHSPDLLDTFTERFRNDEEIGIYVFDGMGHIRPVNYDNIREEMGEWELGDLYRTNDPALGAWPW